MKKILSSRQFRVMNILWDSDRPLLASEISTIGSIHISTVQASIKTLEKLKYVEMAEIVHSRNVLARTYHPLITKKEYLNIISSEMQKSELAKESLIALVEKEDDKETLLKIKEIIQGKFKR